MRHTMQDNIEDGVRSDLWAKETQVNPMNYYPASENENCPADDPSTNFEENDFEEEEEDFRLYLSDSEEENEAALKPDSRSDQIQEEINVAVTDRHNQDVQILGEVPARTQEEQEIVKSVAGSLENVGDSESSAVNSSEVENLEEENIEQSLNAIQISADIETSDEEELLVEHIVEVSDDEVVEVNDEDDVEVNDEDDVKDEDEVEVPSLFGLQTSFLHQPIRMAGRNCLGIVVAERENDPLDTDSEPGYVPDEEIVVDEITSAEEDQVEAGNEEIRLQPEVESMDEDPDPEVELRNTQIETSEEELEPEGLNPEIESSDVEDRGHDGASADEEDSNEEEGTNLKENENNIYNIRQRSIVDRTSSFRPKRRFVKRTTTLQSQRRHSADSETDFKGDVRKTEKQRRKKRRPKHLVEEDTDETSDREDLKKLRNSNGGDVDSFERQQKQRNRTKRRTKKRQTSMKIDSHNSAQPKTYLKADKAGLTCLEKPAIAAVYSPLSSDDELSPIEIELEDDFKCKACLFSTSDWKQYFDHTTICEKDIDTTDITPNPASVREIISGQNSSNASEEEIPNAYPEEKMSETIESKSPENETESHFGQNEEPNSFSSDIAQNRSALFGNGVEEQSENDSASSGDQTENSNQSSLPGLVEAEPVSPKSDEICLEKSGEEISETNLRFDLSVVEKKRQSISINEDDEMEDAPSHKESEILDEKGLQKDCLVENSETALSEMTEEGENRNKQTTAANENIVEENDHKLKRMNGRIDVISCNQEESETLRRKVSSLTENCYELSSVRNQNQVYTMNVDNQFPHQDSEASQESIQSSSPTSSADNFSNFTHPDSSSDQSQVIKSRKRKRSETHLKIQNIALEQIIDFTNSRTDHDHDKQEIVETVDTPVEQVDVETLEDYLCQDVNCSMIKTVSIGKELLKNKVRHGSGLTQRLNFLSKIYLKASRSSTCKSCMSKSDFSLKLSAKKFKLETRKAVSCSQCRFATTIPDDLVEHYLDEHPIPMYYCSKCKFSSSSTIDVMVHFSQAHNAHEKMIS